MNITFSEEIITIISVVSSCATIIASIVAIITLSIWRKQHHYGEKFKVLMELEDSYQLLLNEYYGNFNFFFQVHKLAAESTDKDKEYRKLVNDKIQDDYQQFKINNELAIYSKNYQLSYSRATRLNFDMESLELLKFKVLDDFHNEILKLLKINSFSSDDDRKALLIEFANKFSDFNNKGIEHFKKIRESI